MRGDELTRGGLRLSRDLSETTAHYGRQFRDLDEPVISGPFTINGGSLILEFLQPHRSRNATALIRATFKHENPLCKKGAGYPQAPPLHLHFNQSESFEVLQGKMTFVKGYSVTKKVYTPEDGRLEIKPWVPHSFHPHAEGTEDTIFLSWAHPDNTDEIMDRVFFTNLLLYNSDVFEKKVPLNPFQIMLTQHISASTLVWFPTATWLGPLRWWVPWKVQALFATMGRLMGLTPMMERYTSKVDLEAIQKAKII
ncbi:hypothetical protein N431DRAFT_527040 [Stipitochalara longipes BDJ]|nr:hypothetical protein N431DRAFT_527040 [Stipitochalara longipes BDJ]